MTQRHRTFSGRKHHESLSVDHVELSFSESDETVSKTGILGCAGQEEEEGLFHSVATWSVFITR